MHHHIQSIKLTFIYQQSSCLLPYESNSLGFHVLIYFHF